MPDSIYNTNSIISFTDQGEAKEFAVQEGYIVEGPYTGYRATNLFNVRKKYTDFWGETLQITCEEEYLQAVQKFEKEQQSLLQIPRWEAQPQATAEEPHVEYIHIASGSSGNAHALYSQGSIPLLLDTGIGVAKFNQNAVTSGGVAYNTILGGVALITHHHSDHYKKQFLNRLKLQNWQIVEPDKCITPHYILKRFGKTVITTECYEGDDISWVIQAIPVKHDPNILCVAYGIRHVPTNTLTVYGTDLNYVPKELDSLRGKIDLLVLECNHEPLLFESSPQKAIVKGRTLNTHLSRDKFFMALHNLQPKHARAVHLSKSNMKEDFLNVRFLEDRIKIKANN